MDKKRTFKYPTILRIFLGTIVSVCVVLSIVQAFRSHWPEVTLLLIFSIGSGSIFWLSSLEVLYAESELLFRNFLYSKKIPLSEVHFANYESDQRILRLTYGAERKRAGFQVLGEDFKELALILENQFPAHKFQLTLTDDSNLRVKAPWYVWVINGGVLASSILLLALVIMNAHTVLQQGQLSERIINYLGLLALLVSPISLCADILGSWRNQFNLRKNVIEFRGVKYETSRIKDIAVHGFSPQQFFRFRLLFDDGAVLAIKPWALRNHPYIIDLILGVASRSESLTATVNTSLKKARRNLALIMIALGIVFLCTGFEQKLEYRKTAQEQNEIAVKGILLNATMVNEPDSPCSHHKRYSYSYNGSTYSFDFPQTVSCRCHLQKDSELKVKVLPGSPSIHTLVGCPDRKRDIGWMTILISAIFMATGIVAFLKPPLTLEKIMSLRTSGPMNAEQK